MKILVTGADGFIGSHLVEKLVSIGHNVNAFVYYNSFNSYGWIDNINKNIKKRIKIFSGDIRDEKLLKVAARGCDVVVHLAALIGIPDSYNSPKSYVDTNITGTLNVLQVAKDLKIKKIIHTSTSEIYGSPEYLPIDEKHPVNGQSPYSATKIAADQLAISFFKSFNLPVNIIRPFNTYGPRQSARAVIPTIILQLLSGYKELKIGNINTTRDFSYIEDTIDGFVACINKKNIQGEIINLGSGREISIKNLIKTISKEMSVNVKILQEKQRKRPLRSEVNRLLSNNKKALKLLKWKPKYQNKSGLIIGIKKTIEWFSRDENLEKYKADLYNI